MSKSDATSPDRSTRRRMLAMAPLAPLFLAGSAAVVSAQDRGQAGPANPNVDGSPADVTASITTLNQLLTAIDDTNWRLARRLMARQVLADYSTLTGEPAGQVKADDLVEGWEESLGRLTGTQHLAGTHLADVRGNGAIVRAHVQATHVAQVGNTSKRWPRRVFDWTVGGRYRAGMRRDAASPTGWTIQELTFVYLWENGDRRILDREYGE